MRTLFGAIALLSVAACATQSPPLMPQKVSFDDSVKAMQQNNEPKAVIEYYARLAALKNADAMVLGYDSAVREAMSDIPLRDFVAKSIVPFFASYQGMDREDTVIPTKFPAGRTGEIHYTYILSPNNTVKPVVFSVVNDNGRYHIASVALNSCMGNKNPDSKGRCR